MFAADHTSSESHVAALSHRKRTLWKPMHAMSGFTVARVPAVCSGRGLRGDRKERARTHRGPRSCIHETGGTPNASPQQLRMYADQAYRIDKTEPEYDQTFQINGSLTLNQGLGGVLLKPWGQRSRSQTDLVRDLQHKWNSIGGAKVVAFPLPSPPGSQGFPVQFVITTTEPVASLERATQAVLAQARKDRLFWFSDSDLKIDQPKTRIVADRSAPSTLGMNQADFGAALSAALGGELCELPFVRAAFVQGHSTGDAVESSQS